ATINALMENKNPRAIQPLINKLFNSSGNSKIIDQITKALSKLGTNEMTQLYIDALHSKKQYVKFAITKSAIDAPASFWSEKVIIEAANDEEPEIKSMALFALKRTGSKGSVSTIIESLNDYDSSVRLSAIRSLSSLPEASNYKNKFVETFNDEDFKVRIAAVKSLANVKADWVMEVLEDVVENNPDENMAMTAITAMSESPDKNSAVPFLGKIARSDNANLSYTACNALVNIDNTLVRKELIKNLKTPSNNVKINTLIALERLGDSSAIGAIQRLKDDPDPKVQKQAMQTLHVLSLKKSIRKTKKYKYAQKDFSKEE
ncbi:MAG: HEAT repeat domain-containing protein, partial [Vampirovibrionia bacterium]